MLQITIPACEKNELYDEEKQEFILLPAKKERTLQLEHSLISISKWEAKWCKAFFSKQEKSYEEIVDYIRCMTLTPNVDPEDYYRITDEGVNEISKYIEAPMTATEFYEDKTKKSNRETVTAERIYYSMIALNIPFECQKWHINRLLTLIRVCNIENAPPKKLSKGEIMRRNASLNAARRKQLNTKG